MKYATIVALIYSAQAIKIDDFLSTENDPDYVAEDALATTTGHYHRPRLTKIMEDERAGVPVLVHPESMLLPSVTQDGSASMRLFETGTIVVGADEISAV